jgi:hypothetical protein
VLASIGPSNPRTILWELNDHTWRYVGDPASPVFPIAINASGTVLGQARDVDDLGIAMICSLGGSWQRLGTADGMWPVNINDYGDAVGYAKIDGLARPWLLRASRELVWLPYVRDHHTQPTAINNSGQILGSAGADHGSHVLIWEEAS